MKKKTVTETQVGNTLFIVTSECSPIAKETVEEKLERLICRHLSDTESYQTKRSISLAMYSNQSEYGQ